MTNKLLTIGIRRYLVTQPRNKRTRKAAYYIRERISHYMKIEMDKVRFGKDLNNAITARAKQMKPVKLNIEIDKGIAIATLFKEQAAQKAPSIAEQKQAAKAESKEQAKKASAQPTKAKPASERTQKISESSARTTSAAQTETSRGNESAVSNQDSRK